MDRTVSLEKSLDILDTNQFTKLSTDPTRKTGKNPTSFMESYMENMEIVFKSTSGRNH